MELCADCVAAADLNPPEGPRIVTPYDEPVLKRSRQRGIVFWMAAILVPCGLVAVGLIAVLGFYVAGVAEHPERLAVRHWLRSHSGVWEEVYWFPPTPLQGSQVIIEAWSDDWTTIEATGQAVRLKYSTNFAFGGTVLVDEVFLISESGQVVRTISADKHRLRGESEDHWRERIAATDSVSEQMQIEFLQNATVEPRVRICVL